MPSPHIGAEAITPVISATGRIQGNSAIPVYVYTSIPSDRRGLGMAAQPVVFITDSDLVENGGQYKLQGRLTALPVIQMPVGSRAIGMPAIPVYDVTNKAWPPAFNPVVPTPPSSFPPITTGLQLVLDTQATEIASLNDGDPIPATWHDTSGLHHDFTRGAGSTGLTKQTDANGKPYIQLNGTDDWMLGIDFADNLPSFEVFTVTSIPSIQPGDQIVISKNHDYSSGAGWWAAENGGIFQQDAGGSNWIQRKEYPKIIGPHVRAYRYPDLIPANNNIVRDGLLPPMADSSSGVITTGISNTEPVRLFANGSFLDLLADAVYAIMIYAPLLSPADEATMIASLTAKYSVVLGSAPQFVSASVGPANPTNINVLFSTDVVSTDFSLGVTIKVNGVPAVISGSTPVSPVTYVLSAPVVNGDVVTWEYDATTGNTFGKTSGLPLPTTAAQAVTNNVP